MLSIARASAASINLCPGPHALIASMSDGRSLASARASLIAVASPQHPLHKMNRILTNSDLRRHRHLVVRDSSSTRRGDALALEATQRWTFSNIRTSIDAAIRGYGFAWFPEEKIRMELDTGVLAPLNMREGSERHGTLYLIHADRDAAGPGSLRLAEIIRVTTAQACREHMAQTGAASPNEGAAVKAATRSSVAKRKLGMRKRLSAA